MSDNGEMTDWGQLISFRPGRVLRPTSLDELTAALEQLHRDGGRVRVPGSLHSCSEIVVSDAILDTSGLPKTIDFDDGDGAVEVTANMSLHDFLDALAKRGKSVTATGGTDHQTLAGLISTGTAGASSRWALFELLEWAEFVTVDRETGKAVERRIASGDDDFPALVTSLGLLGVLTRLRFRLVDERHFAVVMKVVDIDDVLPDLDGTSDLYDFWRVNLVPDSTKALLWAATDIPRSDSKPDGDYPEDQSEQILDTVFQILDRLGGEGPLLSGPLEVVYDVMARTYDDRHFTGPLRNMLPVDRRAPLRVAMAEWSFRPQDLQRVLGECQQYFGEHRWPNIPTEIQLTKVDEGFMSAWNWSGLRYIAKLNFMYLTEVCTKPEEKAEIYSHLRGLWRHLEQVGIPFKAHWGKINFIDHEFARRNHDVDHFLPLVSPMFMNRYLEERLPC
ncbi:MAG TPA: FAD-binding oxidoreductase [Actinomycetes bacterium]|nr:FAD-binding oxidoreductase [Actinomycetes bacterium]